VQSLLSFPVSIKSLATSSLSFLIIPHSAFISPLTGSNILLLIAQYDFMLLVLNSKGR
jgi:hypothetical protein